MNFLHRYTLGEVHDADSLATFAQQRIGTAPVRASERGRYLASVKSFFGDYPAANYVTLGRTVEWAGAKRRRIARAWNIPRSVPWAFKDGFLPELDPANVTPEQVDPDLESRIASALLVETDNYWCRLLTYCQGDRGRLYAQWLEYRQWLRAKEVCS